MKENVEVLDLILKNKSGRINAFIWLVKTAGKRNAFICGCIPDSPLISEEIIIHLKGNYKIFVQGRGGRIDENILSEVKETGAVIEKYFR